MSHNCQEELSGKTDATNTTKTTKRFQKNPLVKKNLAVFFFFVGESSEMFYFLVL